MTRYRHVSVKDAAWQIMESAYIKASANGTLPAHARQIMYAARAYIQRTADRDLGDKFDQYFTQTLLPDYITETGVDWNVVYDARGHFLEPHTGKVVPLGTLQVRDYLASIGRHQVPESRLRDLRRTDTPLSARRIGSAPSSSSRRKGFIRSSRR